MGQRMPAACAEGRSARCTGADLAGAEPAGLFYASFKEGNADGRDTVGRYYNYPSEDLAEGVLSRCRQLELWLNRSQRGQGFDGTAATMMHVVVQKHRVRRR